MTNRFAGPLAIAAAASTVLTLLVGTQARRPEPTPLTPEEKAAEERRVADLKREQALNALERSHALVTARARRFSIAGWVSIALPFIGWGVAGLIFAFSIAPLVVLTGIPLVVGVGFHIAAASITRKETKRFAAQVQALRA
ncbi:hypothetical protein [Microbacterium sp. 77mftsu3.1]|uniref:hypothetical protein n=1 Tax=Microbacterium sp. 77mftsu3.1 TaxID=1761802 RepID=UPI000363B278|nr:hypothetical protein [Microbacterium sp. 77mftsu3.1]SDH56209.1 hypothetical protein SAMN04488590_3584 [Microbacterium sp. 77mftsu3.1]